MRVISHPPPVPPGRFLQIAMYFSKEFIGMYLVDLSLDSCTHVIRMFFEWSRENRKPVIVETEN